HRRADDDHVFHHGRRRMDADLARLEIDLLALAEHRADLEIDDPVLAERGDERSVLRAQLDEAIAGRHVDDPIVALAVGPVRDAASRELARRNGGALAL